MPKKKNEQESPKVTNLPLPASDTPLVIDLPDGQKIVIGKMQPGSVIEVATWRGTGRPDSRTNRLMMGMNSGSEQVRTDSSPSPQSNEVEKSANKAINKILPPLKSLVSMFKNFASQTSTTIKNRKPIATKIEAADPQSTSSLALANDVDEWLQKVLEKSEKRGAKAAQIKPAKPKQTNSVQKKAQAKKAKN